MQKVDNTINYPHWVPIAMIDFSYDNCCSLDIKIEDISQQHTVLSSANEEWGLWCDWSRFILHIKYQISIVPDHHLFFGTNYNIHWTNINNKIIEHRSYASFARCLPKTSGMMFSCDNQEKNCILNKNPPLPPSQIVFSFISLKDYTLWNFM